MITEKIKNIQAEIVLYEAIYDDFVTQKIPVINTCTDAVYWVFCDRHPDVKVSQRQFTRILCDELNLKTERCRIDGERGYIYVPR